MTGFKYRFALAHTIWLQNVFKMMAWHPWKTLEKSRKCLLLPYKMTTKKSEHETVWGQIQVRIFQSFSYCCFFSVLFKQALRIELKRNPGSKRKQCSRRLKAITNDLSGFGIRLNRGCEAVEAVAFLTLMRPKSLSKQSLNLSSFNFRNLAKAWPHYWSSPLISLQGNIGLKSKSGSYFGSRMAVLMTKDSRLPILVNAKN